jgi:hypothetical protein
VSKLWRHPVNVLKILAVSALLVSAFCDSAQAQEAVAEQGVDVLQPCAVEFECIQHLELKNVVMSWRLLFDPEPPGIYYAAEWIMFDLQKGRKYREVIGELITPPEGRRHYRFFEHKKVRDWRRLWLFRRWVWRELEVGSEQHKQLCFEYVRLLGLTRKLRAGVNPATLTF